APLVVDVTLTGSARPRLVLTLGGARPGDAIYVTCAAGAAASGLGWLRAAASALRPSAPRHVDPNTAGDALTWPRDPGERACVARYRRPEPRARVGAL